MKKTLEKFLSTNSFKNKSPEHINLVFGTIFEYSRELNSIESLEKGINMSSSVSLENFQDDDKMTFYYNLSNAWSYKKQMTHTTASSNFWEFENLELTSEILNCRKALLFSEGTKNLKRKCEILTNLGNDLSHLGRYSEAIELWNRALSIDAKFSMALGNFGFGVFHYSKILCDEGHAAYFLKESYLYLKKAIESDEIYIEAKNSFKSIVLFIEKYVDADFLKMPNEFKAHSLGETPKEVAYKQWCLENILFLNPLNDIYKETIVAQDILNLPTMVVRKGDSRVYNYHSIFNQIKQEFCSARYLFYEFITDIETHFSDKGIIIIDTLDKSICSFNAEKGKTAFKTFYSILDKIAYLLNSYLELGYKPHEITFRKIWHERNKLNPKIENTQNWGLRGLFWLSKDFFEKDDFQTLLEPEAQELSLIRNFIEHKSFTLTEFYASGVSEDGFTYNIEKEIFINKTFKLMKIIRAALIYTSLMINIEEQKKEKPDFLNTINLHPTI
ncbi:LA2681 family HEPN domain-containing protein [Flavobacterium sp.]|uniref:LA2681 family HEPN domain-containing protein n=1 Tax=Flavobacterium sp. TaxID=239 RepID=UPI0026138F18|nr:LA2681 family HEPN domain-containing protein [Flavobacterium sp.]